MLNIYLIYVSSIETGDVNVSKRVYTSFGKAKDDIDGMIKQYVTDRKSENNYRIVNKSEFDVKKLNKDSSMSIGGYFFCKKNSSSWIYKKVVVEGRIWCGSKLEKVGKISILSEINIPVDKKLLRLIKNIQDEKEDVIGSGESLELIKSSESTKSELTELTELSEPIIKTNVMNDLFKELVQNISKKDSIDTYDYDEEDTESEEIESDTDNYTISRSNPSNYEHGKHVSFIHELKMKLEKRRCSIMNFEVPISNIEIGKPNDEHLVFINTLSNIKNKLTRITPPSSPNFNLGRVIENIPVKMFENIEYELNFEDDSVTWESSDEESEIVIKESYEYILMSESSDEDFLLDIPEVTGLPEVPKYFPDSELTESTEFSESYESSEISDSSGISDSSELIPEPPQVPDSPEDSYVDDHIEQIVDDIMKVVNFNTIKSSSNMTEVKSADNSMKYDKNIDDITEEWDIMEYYEGITNSDPVPRKYINHELRLSM